MADIQLIQCKNQQKTSLYGRNSVPYNEIGTKKSNDDVRTLTGKMLSDCQNLNRLMGYRGRRERSW